MNKDVSLLMSIHQRDDIEYKFQKVIESVFTNSYIPTYFLLLIDGPINTNFKEKINQLRNQFGFQIYHHPKNIGLANILNIGLTKISTKWVIRADGDDINLSKRFKTLVDNINTNISVIGSFTEEIDENNKKRIKKVPVNNYQIKKYSKYRNPFNHNSVMYQVDHILKVGGYPDLYLKEDYGLWVKLLSNNFKCYNIPEVLVQVSFDNRSYYRRAGMKYLKSDLDLIKLQYSEGQINFLEKLVISFIKFCLFITPIFVKKLIYDVLRSR